MNAVAITGNLTVTGQTSGGYATLAPTTVTPTSALNFPSGDTRANNVTMPLSPTGRLQARVSADRAHLILDVTGYFLAGPVAATYTPLGPVRVMDSRPGTRVGVSGGFLAGVSAHDHGRRRERHPSRCGRGDRATSPSVGQSAAGYLAVTPTATTTPSTSTLNFPQGDTRANGLTAPLDPAGRLAIVYKGPSGAQHPRDPRRDRLLPGGRGRAVVPSDRAGSSPGHPRRPRLTRCSSGPFPQRSRRGRSSAGGHFLIPLDAGARSRAT